MLDFFLAVNSLSLVVTVGLPGDQRRLPEVTAPGKEVVTLNGQIRKWY